MQGIITAMVGASAVAFVLAIVGSFLVSGHMFGTSPEAFSRASNNLALLAIAVAVCLNGKASLGGGS